MASTCALTPDSRLRCHHCSAPASRIHVLPWWDRVQRFEASCGTHDVAGYTIPVSDLALDPLDVLGHLADLSPAAAVELVVWLGPLGRRALRGMTPA